MSPDGSRETGAARGAREPAGDAAAPRATPPTTRPASAGRDASTRQAERPKRRLAIVVAPVCPTEVDLAGADGAAAVVVVGGNDANVEVERTRRPRYGRHSNVPNARLSGQDPTNNARPGCNGDANVEQPRGPHLRHGRRCRRDVSRVDANRLGKSDRQQRQAPEPRAHLRAPTVVARVAKRETARRHRLGQTRKVVAHDRGRRRHLDRDIFCFLVSGWAQMSAVSALDDVCVCVCVCARAAVATLARRL